MYIYYFFFAFTGCFFAAHCFSGLCGSLYIFCSPSCNFSRLVLYLAYSLFRLPSSFNHIFSTEVFFNTSRACSCQLFFHNLLYIFFCNRIHRHLDQMLVITINHGILLILQQLVTTSAFASKVNCSSQRFLNVFCPIR